MSPALETPLSRREAMTAILVMLSFVLGVGDLEDATAAEPAIDQVTELDGAFLGYVDGHQVATDLQLRVADGVTSASLRRLGSSNDPIVIETFSPDVARFVGLVMGRQVEAMA